MSPTVRKQVEELQRMKVNALREKYREVFGEETCPLHRQFLVRRIG